MPHITGALKYSGRGSNQTFARGQYINELVLYKYNNQTFIFQVLDAATMMNLELIQNGTTATLEGTLLGTLDLCVTPFGMSLC